jgi:hypothetical protein
MGCGSTSKKSPGRLSDSCCLPLPTYLHQSTLLRQTTFGKVWTFCLELFRRESQYKKRKKGQIVYNIHHTKHLCCTLSISISISFFLLLLLLLLLVFSSHIQVHQHRRHIHKTTNHNSNKGHTGLILATYLSYDISTTIRSLLHPTIPFDSVVVVVSSSDQEK